MRDSDHRIVGTTFDPHSTKIGNEDFVPWLIRHVVPQVSVTFSPVDVGTRRVWILEIGAARDRPVSFKGREFIRVGSYKKPLKDNPDFERRLWRTFEREAFETGVAADRLTGDDVLRVIDYPAYFHVLELPLPESRSQILALLETDRLIARSSVGWSVTNLGAVLFARNLADFETVRRKFVRVIHYRGSNRVETIREQQGTRGYASGFAGLIGFIDGLLPRNEEIGQALREDQPLYPQLAIRELPAPYIEVVGDHTKAVLLAPRSLTRMDKRDRVRAVYLHACLRHVSGERTTNSSVRTRFGIPSSNSPQASRLLNEAVDQG